MELVSVCPLRTTSILWQKGPTAWVLTVICKATYLLLPGESQLAPDQEAPNEADNHWDDDISRSVYAPSDMAPLKVRADVILVGSAFAPGGVPTRSLNARLVVNKIDKTIECHADRVVAHDGSIQEGTGFTRMPLVYERAAGGPGTSNPVGVRRDARDGYGRIALPNLQQPGRSPTAPEGLEPVGFGPIAPRWPARLDKLGRHAPTWSPRDWAQRPLPGDIDFAHFNVAPPDQQIAVLRENERLVLEHLHREHARLMTALPGVRPCAFVEGRSGAPFRLPMHADTLWIDSDRALLAVTWRRQLPLDRPDEQGRIVVAMEQPGQTLTWSDVEPLMHAGDKSDHPTLAPPVHQPPAAPPPSERTSAAMPMHMMRPPAATLPFATVESPTSSTMQYSQPAPRAGDGARDSALPFIASQMGNATSPLAAAAPPWSAPKPPPRSEPDSAVYAVAPLPPPVPPPLPPPAAVAPPAPLAPPAPAALPVPALVDSPWASAGGASGSANVAAPTFAKGAAAASVLGASNAAATKDTWGTPRPEPVKIAPLPVAAAPAREGSGDILELLWFDPDSVPRVRRTREWKPILDALEQRPVDRDLDDPALASEPMEMEDRREVFEVLAHGLSTDGVGVERTLDAGVRADGKFVPQLALLSAELGFEFDELGTLRATVATVSPMVTPADEALKAAVESAKEFLKTADELTPPAVADSMTARVREAFAQSKRTVPETHLEEQTDRVLLSQRRYQKRIVFGAPHLRCLVRAADDPPIPAYLPESLAKKLPMFQRFRGRLIAEVHQQADQYETHRAALRVVALARATARRADW